VKFLYIYNLSLKIGMTDVDILRYIFSFVHLYLNVDNGTDDLSDGSAVNGTGRRVVSHW
jgi:hypothetical protein